MCARVPSRHQGLQSAVNAAVTAALQRQKAELEQQQQSVSQQAQKKHDHERQEGESTQQQLLQRIADLEASRYYSIDTTCTRSSAFLHNSFLLLPF
tara:strand:+ start:60 stop:347 length:288 start_codon:yes stop_codon:yes gene_type:complete